MPKLLNRVTMLAIVVLLVFAPVLSSQAQDSMTHICDSTLISLLFIAEYDYGFHSMMDASTFDKGQFAPAFDAMMAMMEAMPAEEMMEATEEAMMEEGEMMMEGDMTVLTPGIVADEDPACTALRAELEGFFYTHFAAEMMMMMEEGG